jgi:hypothetical protein
MSDPPSWRRRCGRCGTEYEPSAFADLAPVRTLAGDDLTAHAVHWPEGVFVDVRACARCKTPIARLAHQVS